MRNFPDLNNKKEINLTNFNISEDNINKLNDSIVQINTKDETIGTGFFIQLQIYQKDFCFLLINNTKLKLKIDSNQDIEVNILYNKNMKLDKNRFIGFSQKGDLTYIEIFDKDILSDKTILKYSLIDDDYKKEYNYSNNFIYSIVADDIGNKKGIRGKLIKKINNFEFELFLEQKICFPGSPIFLENKSKMLKLFGIYKKDNSGYFIGLFINEVKKKFLKFKYVREEYKIINVESKKDFKYGIHFLDLILKKDCKPEKDYYEFFNFLKNESSDFFVYTSIFDKYDDYKNIKYDLEEKIKNGKLSELEESCIGSILGMAIGDAIGARVEFKKLDYEYKGIKNMGDHPAGKFNLKPGQWTDDSSMGLCIADSLIENKGNFDPRNIMMRFLLWWFHGYNNAFRFDKDRPNRHSVGLGGNISGSLYKYMNDHGKDEYTDYGDKNTSGNGSIMRNAAIPICYFRDEAKALEYAEKQSKITHKGDEAAGCCQLLTFIIIKILEMKLEKEKNHINIEPKNLKEILENLKDFDCEYDNVKYLACSKPEKDKNRNWNWKNEDFKYSEERAKKHPGYIGSYCMDCLSMALHILYSTDNFKDAILKAVNLCGDADSLGSVVGQIAGAFYGLKNIPKEWIETINKWDNKEIELRGYILCHLKENEKEENKKNISEKNK